MTIHTVLVADDDAAIRSLLRLTLPRDDYRVLEAADGGEAVDVAARDDPALVLLDWQMPGPGGDEVLSRIKAQHAERPVVILTAEHRPEYRRQAEDLGADAFLTKPFSPLRLLDVIERLLGEEDDAAVTAPRPGTDRPRPGR